MICGGGGAQLVNNRYIVFATLYLGVPRLYNLASMLVKIWATDGEGLLEEGIGAVNSRHLDDFNNLIAD